MFEGKKDEVALVLFGTEESNNTLYDENQEYYKHVNLVSAMQPPGMGLLRYLANSITYRPFEPREK